MPIVSVIIPAFQAQDFIDRAIASARAQTMSDIEIIVVNDCSRDDTAGAVRRAAQNDPRVRLINHEVNQGPSAARNTAIVAAKGRWIAVLDADDTMAPERLEKLVAQGEHLRADIIADDLIVVYETLTPSGEHVTSRHLYNSGLRVVDLAAFARNNQMFNGLRHTGYLKPLFRRSFLSATGLTYDPQVRVGEDYMFVATALALGARYMLVGEPLYNYHFRAGSLSRRFELGDVEKLTAADDRFWARFGAGLDEVTAGAVKERRRSLDDALAFVTSIEALKSRQFGHALSSALRRPSSLRHFAMPIRARIERLVGRGVEA